MPTEIRKPLPFATTLAAALLLTGTALAADPLATRYYEDALGRFNSGDAKGAMIQLKNALQRDPAQLSAKILLGRTYLALGEPGAAAEELLEARQLGADPLLIALPLARARNQSGQYQANIEQIAPTEFPTGLQPDLWVELGLAQLRSRDPAGARIAFGEALALNPTHSGATIGLARIPLQKKDFAEAERLADSVIAIDSQNAEAWFVKGSTAHATGRFDEAANAYGKAHEIDPRHHQAAIGEAAALLDGGKPARAAALLQDLHQAAHYTPTVPYLLSKSLAAIGRHDEAKQALGDAVSIVSQVTPSDIADQPQNLLVYGNIAFENGDLEQAYRFLNAYVESGGRDLRGRKKLARVLISMDRPGEALRILVRSSAGGNADAEILTLMGDANVGLGDFDAAQRYYRGALDSHGAGPAIVRRLAIAQYRGGHRDEGLSTMQELVDLLPPEAGAETALLLGFLYLAEGRLDEAEHLANSLLAQDAQNNSYRNFLATTLANRGRTGEARKIYEQLVAEDADYRPARFNLVKLDIAEGRYAAASQEINAILAIEPANPDALYDAGHLARLQGDFRTATQVLERLRSIRPTWIKGIEELVRVYLAEGNRAAALKSASDLYAKSPKNVSAHQLLASAQMANGDSDDARQTLKKASLLAGNDSQQLFAVGEQQMMQQAFEDAAWTFTKAVALAPSAVDARFNLASSLLRSGKVAEAEVEADELRNRHPDLVIVDVLLADIRRAQGRSDEAVVLYRSALQRQPQPNVVSSLYQVLMLDGRPREAVAVLVEWLADSPDSVEVLNLLAEHHLTHHNSEAALPIYERLAEMAPESAQIQNNLAVALRDFDSERALKAALRAHDLSPQNPFVLDTLGWSMVQVGELEKGLGYLREARARFGRSPTIRYHLGVALLELGNRQEALNEFRGALQLGGKFPERSDAETRVRHLEAGG